MNFGETERFTTGKVAETSENIGSWTETPEPATTVSRKNRKAVIRSKLTTHIPSSLLFRLESIIEAERRLPNVVGDKIVSDFLEVASFEPRPYIPFELQSEQSEQYVIRIDRDLVERLKARASSEGRDWKVLFLRAVFDYVRASPDDPVKVESKLEPKIGGDFR